MSILCIAKNAIRFKYYGQLPLTDVTFMEEYNGILKRFISTVDIPYEEDKTGNYSFTINNLHSKHNSSWFSLYFSDQTQAHFIRPPHPVHAFRSERLDVGQTELGISSDGNKDSFRVIIPCRISNPDQISAVGLKVVTHLEKPAGLVDVQTKTSYNPLLGFIMNTTTYEDILQHWNIFSFQCFLRIGKSTQETLNVGLLPSIQQLVDGDQHISITAVGVKRLRVTCDPRKNWNFVIFMPVKTALDSGLLGNWDDEGTSFQLNSTWTVPGKRYPNEISTSCNTENCSAIYSTESARVSCHGDNLRRTSVIETIQ
ncbi:uncharacterized protein LOC118435521 [Folsomia candida]|uniref:uncharacterized protein LOC118435521 n=1 Tax=Folsomia candida TaxID=158441 RepID=UPI0016055E09|nr:uncharacterized protein LOC118435521 [Folsomia candida]